MYRYKVARNQLPVCVCTSVFKGADQINGRKALILILSQKAGKKKWDLSTYSVRMCALAHMEYIPSK